MDRRVFLKTGAGSAAAMALGTGFAAEDKGTPRLAKRRYGRTDIELSIIGFGGIVVMNAEQSSANRAVAKAVERGINYFDVAPSYGDAEIKLGPALEPYRKDVFLACKTAQRERKAAEAEFARSLKLLRTDHFDLYQLHAITDVEKDVDSVFMKEGVMDMIDREKRDGRIRYVGFSAHSEEAALAALDRYDFDSILFPVSFATYLEGNFGPRVMEVCRKKKVAVLALKGMAKQHWQGDAMLRQMYPKCWYEPLHEPDWSELGLRWTLSQPVVSAVPPGEEPLFWKAVEIAERFKPIREQETARLKEYAATLKPLFRGHA